MNSSELPLFTSLSIIDNENIRIEVFMTTRYRPVYHTDPGFPHVVNMFTVFKRLGLSGTRYVTTDEYLWLAEYLARTSSYNGGLR